MSRHELMYGMFPMVRVEQASYRLLFVGSSQCSTSRVARMVAKTKIAFCGVLLFDIICRGRDHKPKARITSGFMIFLTNRSRTIKNPSQKQCDEWLQQQLLAVGGKTDLNCESISS